MIKTGIQGLDEALNLARNVAVSSAMPKEQTDTSQWRTEPVDTSQRRTEPVATRMYPGHSEQLKTEPGVVGVASRAIVGGTQGLIGGVKGLFKGITEKVPETVQDIKSTWLDPRKGIYEKLVEIPLGLVAGKMIGGDIVGETFAGAIEGAYKGATTETERGQLSELGQEAGDFLADIAGSTDTSFIAKRYRNLSPLAKERVDDWAGYALDATNLVGLGIGKSVASKGVKQVVKTTAERLGQQVGGQVVKTAKPLLGRIYEGAVDTASDLFVGKKTPEENLMRVFAKPNTAKGKLMKSEKYLQEKQVLIPAIKDAVAKKEISIVRDGIEVPGALPETVEENVELVTDFLQSTRAKINDSLDNVGGDIKVNIADVANKAEANIYEMARLGKITKQSELESALGLLDEYRAGVLGSTILDGRTAENFLQTLNQQMKSLYVKSGLTTDQEAMMQFASALRNELNMAVESLDNVKFGTLKKQYGAGLQAMEEAMHYYNVSKRQNPIGLFEGLSYLKNPTSILGSLERTVGGLIKEANSRDTAVRRLWQAVAESNDPKSLFPTLRGASAKPKALLGRETLEQNVDTIDDGLIAEARKYKSAEEFIDDNKIYHGTNQEFADFDIELGGSATAGMPSAKGNIFFTKDKSEALSYAKASNKTQLVNQNHLINGQRKHKVELIHYNQDENEMKQIS